MADCDPPGPVLAISPWIEMKLIPLAEMYAMLEAQTHRRFMKTHTPADGIPWFDDSRYIFVARDGRDAFMSLCNHVEHFRDEVRESLNADAPEGVPQFPSWDGDIHGFFTRWLEEDQLFFPHLATFWEERRRPNLLFVHYNDLKADLASEMRRVAAFIGADVPEPNWPEVVARCTFERMRQGEARIGAVDMLFKGGLKTFVFNEIEGWILGTPVEGMRRMTSVKARKRRSLAVVQPRAKPSFGGEVEEFIDCAGKRRRFVLQVYGNGQFLEAREVLAGDVPGARIALPVKRGAAPPWGDIRRRIRERLSRRDLVEDENGRLVLVADVLRGQLTWSNDDGLALVVDDVILPWEEVGRLLSSYEGFGVHLEIPEPVEEWTSTTTFRGWLTASRRKFGSLRCCGTTVKRREHRSREERPSRSPASGQAPTRRRAVASPGDRDAAS